MASNLPEKDYVTVARTDTFSVVHKRLSDPLDDKESAYLIIFNRYNTVEARYSSYMMAVAHMRELERVYQEMFGEAQKPEKKKKGPTLQ